MKTLLSTILLFFSISIFAQTDTCQVSLDNLNDYFGQTVTFCGEVSDVAQPKGITGNPIFLNFGGRYPNHQFTVVVWEEEYQNASIDLLDLLGKELVIKGEIKTYKGKPQIELASLDNLQIR